MTSTNSSTATLPFLQNILDLYFKHFKLSEDVVNRILQVVLDLQHFKSSPFIFAATIFQSSLAIHHISNIDNMYITSYSFSLFSSLPGVLTPVRDDPLDSSVQGLVTPSSTRVNASGEEQVEYIKAKGKKVVSSLDFQEEVDAGAEQVNTAGAEQVNTSSAEQVSTAEGVNTGSIKLSTGDEKLSTGDEQLSTGDEKHSTGNEQASTDGAKKS
ncbi:hypothetical protein Tco_1289139, partial [Tanacetum coccineum]